MPLVDTPALAFATDISHALYVTAMRSYHANLLFRASDPNSSPQDRAQYLNTTVSVMQSIGAAITRLEGQYRVPVYRVAGWRAADPKNPLAAGSTSYTFGYLWTVHSMYYFWRDYGLVRSLCFWLRVCVCDSLLFVICYLLCVGGGRIARSAPVALLPQPYERCGYCAVIFIFFLSFFLFGLRC